MNSMKKLVVSVVAAAALRWQRSARGSVESDRDPLVDIGRRVSGHQTVRRCL